MTHAERREYIKKLALKIQKEKLELKMLLQQVEAERKEEQEDPMCITELMGGVSQGLYALGNGSFRHTPVFSE